MFVDGFVVEDSSVPGNVNEVNLIAGSGTEESQSCMFPQERVRWRVKTTREGTESSSAVTVHVDRLACAVFGRPVESHL